MLPCVVEHNENDLEKKRYTHLDRSTIEPSRQGKASAKKGTHKSKVGLWSV